jgi:uncharacterized protein (TIGR03083 family)
MTPSISRLGLLDQLRQHGTRLADHAADAGLAAAVPTCPEWSVADLVAHAAMVHRWALSKILGSAGPSFREADEIRRSEPDLLAYYREGHGALVDVLANATDDLDAPVFLDNAGPPLDFWTRRQAHETVIHGVDALAAALGRVPTTREAAIDAELALDGLDELMRGFLPRNASELFQGEEFVIAVRPGDAEPRWSIEVGPELDTHDGIRGPVAATFAGSSAELYLGLWNRGAEMRVEGDTGMLARWREAERITWG